MLLVLSPFSEEERMCYQRGCVVIRARERM